MKTKSIYRARMTKQQALIMLRCLNDYLTDLSAAEEGVKDVATMAEIVAVSGLIEQVSAELARAT